MNKKQVIKDIIDNPNNYLVQLTHVSRSHIPFWHSLDEFAFTEKALNATNYKFINKIHHFYDDTGYVYLYKLKSIAVFNNKLKSL